MPPTQIHVLITDSPWEDNSIERKILEGGGIQVTSAHCATPQDVIAVSRDADALLVGWAPITEEVITHLTQCRLLIRYGTGYNNIDTEAATHAGIAVSINSDYCVEEVATHALALLLACHRQLAPLQDLVRRGRWDLSEVLLPTPPLSQQTVGIVGFGRIGRCLAGMVRPLFTRVLVYDPLFTEGSDPDRLVEFVPFDQLLAESDCVSIHVPLTAETDRLFNRESIARMKKGAYLINCARGPIVDEAALAEAVREHHLAGAGLDVLSQEPMSVDHPFRGLPSVIITPHAAWYSTQAEYRLHAVPAQNILRFFAGEPIPLLNRPTRPKKGSTPQYGDVTT